MNVSTSIRKNYFYNTLLTIASFAVPIITFPYVARILGPIGIGKVNFAQSVVAYFVLFASLGIPIYGVREVARFRDKQESLNKVFSEIFVLNCLAMFLSVLSFLSLLLFVDKIQQEKLLFIITGLGIILNIFSFDWLFKGLEIYKFITIRSLISLLLIVLLIFTIINDNQDYILYAAISFIGIGFTNFVNVIYSRKFVKLTLSNLELKQHIKPIFVIFSTTLTIGIYVGLDKTMLGFLAGDESVGLYTAAIKISKIPLAIIGSLGAVLLPRMSYYIQTKRNAEFEALADKSVKFVYFLSLPSMIGIFLLARPIIFVFAGDNFSDSVLTLKLLIPIIFFIGLSGVIGIQILVPLGGESKVLISTIVGAFINLFLNFILIPKYQANGAAVATLLAELSVTLVQLYYIKKYLRIKWVEHKMGYLWFSMIMGFFIYWIPFITDNALFIMFSSVLVGGTIYGSLLLLTKDEFVFGLLRLLLAKLNIRYKNV